MELPVRDVPVTLITGALGVGKTTAIRALFAHRPEGERWAVLVNEFGEVGIDGAVLGASTASRGGLAIREVPGGCICCSAGLSLRFALVQLLREVQPDRLLIEPTGLAHPAAVLDQLRSPGLREAVRLRATVTLVDPHRFLTDPGGEDVVTSRPLSHGGGSVRPDAFADQVLAADVLVANRCDGADPETLQAFRARAARLFPRPLVVATTTFGALDPSWLDFDPTPERVVRGSWLDETPAQVHLGDGDPAAHAVQPVPELHAVEDATSCGWVFPPSVAFDRPQLEAVLQRLVRPGGPCPAGVLRLKGIFRTPRVWLKVDATADAIRWEALNYRRDSRVELIVPAAPAPDWEAVEAALRSARYVPRR